MNEKGIKRYLELVDGMEESLERIRDAGLIRDDIYYEDIEYIDEDEVNWRVEDNEGYRFSGSFPTSWLYGKERIRQALEEKNRKELEQKAADEKRAVIALSKYTDIRIKRIVEEMKQLSISHPEKHKEAIIKLKGGG